jgi:hypothetical protein
VYKFRTILFQQILQQRFLPLPNLEFVIKRTTTLSTRLLVLKLDLAKLTEYLLIKFQRGNFSMNISANQTANFTARLVNYFPLRIQIGPACNIILNPNITHLVIHAHDVTVPSNFTEVFENTCRGKCFPYRVKLLTRLFEYVSTPFTFPVKGQNYCDL